VILSGGLARRNGNNELVSASDTPNTFAVPTHPLASALAGALVPNARVLLLGIGSGRNVPALLAVAAWIEAVEDDPDRARAAAARFASEPRVRISREAYTGPYSFDGTVDGALSTHALLHGTPHRVAVAVAAARERLAPNAPFYITLGSKRDPRFGVGESPARDTFVLRSGSEAGVLHCYFDEAGVRALLNGFTIEELVEQSAAETAGTWAHAPEESARFVHWFVRLRR
jgi:hypothetical protein